MGRKILQVFTKVRLLARAHFLENNTNADEHVLLLKKFVIKLHELRTMYNVRQFQILKT